jgi:hypothetical protein
VSSALDGVLVSIVLLRVKDLPAAGREDVLVALIPVTLNNLAGRRTAATPGGFKQHSTSWTSPHPYKSNTAASLAQARVGVHPKHHQHRPRLGLHAFGSYSEQCNDSVLCAAIVTAALPLASAQPVGVMLLLLSKSTAGPAHLSCVYVLALHACITQDADVILDTKVKQRPRLATGLVDDQLIEGEVVGQDQILLQEQAATAANTEHPQQHPAPAPYPLVLAGAASWEHHGSNMKGDSAESRSCGVDNL